MPPASLGVAPARPFRCSGLLGTRTHCGFPDSARKSAESRPNMLGIIRFQTLVFLNFTSCVYRDLQRSFWQGFQTPLPHALQRVFLASHKRTSGELQSRAIRRHR